MRGTKRAIWESKSRWKIRLSVFRLTSPNIAIVHRLYRVFCYCFWFFCSNFHLVFYLLLVYTLQGCRPTGRGVWTVLFWRRGRKLYNGNGIVYRYKYRPVSACVCGRYNRSVLDLFEKERLMKRISIIKNPWEWLASNFSLQYDPQNHT